MTAPDAPTAMTLEDALWELGSRGYELHGSSCAYGGIEWSIRDRQGDFVHRDVATWPEAVSQALGYRVVERDPTAELVEENAELRRILSECATAAGASAAPTCSLSFFGELPREIRLRRGRDTAELVEALDAVVGALTSVTVFHHHVIDHKTHGTTDALDKAHAALARYRGES